MKTKHRPAPPSKPTLYDLLSRARQLAADYRRWESGQPGDPDRFHSLREMILPGALTVVQSEDELYTTAMFALKTATTARFGTA